MNSVFRVNPMVPYKILGNHCLFLVDWHQMDIGFIKKTPYHLFIVLDYFVFAAYHENFCQSKRTCHDMNFILICLVQNLF